VINGIVHSEATHLLMVREDDRWIGSLSLVVYDIPTGRQAKIEDVVVDSAFRGRGIGKALMEEAIRIAEMKGVKAVSLTSRPSRVAANQLYINMGFKRHETNVYILSL
jgi:ribosomal protein S18 acetylase RimI-like enzyme